MSIVPRNGGPGETFSKNEKGETTRNIAAITLLRKDKHLKLNI